MRLIEALTSKDKVLVPALRGNHQVWIVEGEELCFVDTVFPALPVCVQSLQHSRVVHVMPLQLRQLCPLRLYRLDGQGVVPAAIQIEIACLPDLRLSICCV